MWPTLLLLALVFSCATPPTAPDESPPAAADALPVAIPTVPYVFDARGGDPAVAADLGGPGFTGVGWTTAASVSRLGAAEARPGGTLRMPIGDWPATLRVMGQDWNTTTNAHLADLLYMPLLALDPVTLQPVPALASHWQRDDAQRTYRFRIDPRARWSDGQPVTADDVVATHRLRADPALLSPEDQLVFGQFAVHARSPYLVEVTVPEGSWRSFLQFATQVILPAHEIGDLPASEFLTRYGARFTAGTGPYEVRPDGVVLGERIVLTRRHGWWADDQPMYDGKYNLETLEYVVVRDPSLAYEKLKAGEIDYLVVPKAQWYAEDLPQNPLVQRGLIVRRKFHTADPVGVSGFALNLRRPPLDDVRVRRALQMLYDRRTLIDSLFFGEYVPLRSYFPNAVPEGSIPPIVEYDPFGAVTLLEDAGYTTIGPDGIRVRDGRPLALTLQYTDAIAERYLTVYQEAAKRAGVAITLERASPAALWQSLRQREFEMANVAWSATLFPSPEADWHSSLAAVPDTDNVTGFADPAVDARCAAYDREPDPGRRAALLAEIDAALVEAQPYVLGWALPTQRVAMWDRYGMPDPWAVGRFARREGDRHLSDYWWVDPAKAAFLERARFDPSARSIPGPEERRFWTEWAPR